MKARDFLYLLPLPFVIISYLLIPVTNDVYIFQGVARLTDYYGSFPMSLDAAWEMKPLGNRLIHWILYKLVTLLTDFGSPAYPILLKLVAVAFALGCCYYFARTFKDRVIPIFAVTSLAMLTAANFCIMQAEWFAVLILLLASATLSRNDLKYSAYALAGALLMFVVLIKGITIILLIPVICLIYIRSDNEYIFFERWFSAFVGFMTAGVLFFFACLTILPHALPDMMMTSALARVGQYPFAVYLNTLVDEMFTISAYIPALLPLLVIGIYYMLTNPLPPRKYAAYLLMFYAPFAMLTNPLPPRKYAAYLLMFYAPFAIIFVQGEFFVYHFFVLVIPGLFALILETERPSDPLEITPKDTQTKFYNFAVFTMVILWIIFNSSFGLITQVEEQYHDYPADVADRLGINSEKEVLFLDPGAAPYFFHTNSSCRYSTPMPVQRYRTNWNVTYLPAYAEEYSCIAEYHGKYIVALDSWFGRDLPEREPLYQKIDSEYVKVWNKSWDIYQRK